jgi:MHS family proline/betaine transporter-like MFS transporter
MKKIILSGMIGNGLEWYDYAVYAYFVTTFSKLFFPAGNESAHILLTFGIYAVGFVARPFGAILFGLMGDRAGRRAALVTSIFLMAIPTGCIGLLPTYEQAGIAAPLLLTLMRLLQGLSLGGEFSGSMTYLVEHSPSGKRGTIGSTVVSSLIVGFIFGLLIALAIKSATSNAQFETWGWRIPFLLGVPIALIGFYIRHHCDESPTYVTAKRAGLLSTAPLRETLTFELGRVFQAIGIYISVTMPFYLVTTYFATFTEHSLKRTKEEALTINLLNMVVLLVLSTFSAWLSDRFGRRRVMIVTAVAYLLLSYPLMMLMQRPDYWSILEAQAMMAAMIAFYIGPVPALLVEMFPTRIRSTAMALAYNISAALFGGTSPMVNEWLIKTTGTNLAIAWYLMVSAAVSIVALVYYRDGYRDALR